MTKYFLFLFFAFSFQISFADSVNYISYYNFNNNVEDSGSGSFDGVAYGDLTYITGVLDNGVFFDNEDHYESDYKNDYITLPNVSLNEFSVSIWIKFNKNSHYKEHDAAFYSLGSEDNDGTFFAITVDSNDRLLAKLYCNGHNNIKVYQTDDLNIKDGNWHHIAVTVSNEKITMFQDGIEGNSENTGFDIVVEDQPQFFSYHQWENGTKGSSRINGSIDEFKLFNSVISSNYVSNLFHLSDTGLIAHYSFEGNVENTVNDNLVGSIYGNTSYVSGKVGYSLKFNTTEHTSNEFLGDYVTFPPVSLSSFTVSMWLKYIDNASENFPVPIYSFGSEDSGGSFFGIFVDSNNNLNVKFYHDGHNNLDFNKSISLNDELWHYITVSVTENSMKLYENGELISELTTDFDINIKNVPGYLGMYTWNNGNNKTSRLIGYVDELRVYNYGLNEDEIKDIYEEEKIGYSTSVYLPHFDISDYWETRLTLTNFSANSQDFLIEAYSNSGIKLSEVENSLSAGALLSLKINDLFPNISENTGWLQIKSNSSFLKGMGNYKFLLTESETTLPIISQPSKYYQFPIFENTENRSSAIAFANTENSTTSVTLYLIDESGNTLKTEVIELLSYEKKAFMLLDIFSNFENEKVSLKVISTNTKICCYGLTFINNNYAIVAVTGLTNN